MFMCVCVDFYIISSPVGNELTECVFVCVDFYIISSPLGNELTECVCVCRFLHNKLAGWE